MKLTFRRSLLLSGLFLFPCFPAQTLFAQESPKSFLVHPWSVGQSATYQTKTYKNNNPVHTETTTYSIVDQEEVKGKKYFWVEIEHADSIGPTITLKLQVRQPQAIDFENYLDKGVDLLKPRRKIQKLVFGTDKKFSTVNEFEVPAESVSQIENGPDPSETKDLSGQYEATSKPSFSVRAGSFKSTQFHKTLSAIGTPASNQKPVSQFTDSWGSPDVPIWGEVKRVSQTVDNNQDVYRQETELISSSESGAASKITGTPRIISQEQKRKIRDNIAPNNPLTQPISDHQP